MIAKRILWALVISGLLAVPVIAQSTSKTADVRESVVPVFALNDVDSLWIRLGRLEQAERSRKAEELRNSQSERFEGSWELTVSPAPPPGVTPPPPFHTYLTISRGGAAIGSDRTRPFDSPQHGTWDYLHLDDFAYTLSQDRFDVTGNFVGTFKGRSRITITGEDEFIGVASVEFRDPAGNITLARCATIRATRIKVEPVTSQCASIEPPR